MSDNIILIKILIEILILWFAYYVILSFSKGTRGVHVLRGIVFIALFFVVTKWLGLDTINWIFTKIFAISIVAFLVIFQPELRRGLANIGQHPLASIFFKEPEIINEVVKAVVFLANRKIGALIAIERESKLRHYVDSGVEIDAKVNTELLINIFMPDTPLHDGGVMISGDRIVGAGCLYPLSQNIDISRTFGTRHRAGLGLSEETDAVILIVSEETGSISIAVDGKLSHNMDQETLKSTLNNLGRPKKGIAK